MIVHWKPRSTGLKLLSLFLFALALRLLALLLLPGEGLTEHVESVTVARNLVAGRGFTFDFYGLRPHAPLRSFIPPLFVGQVYLALKLGNANLAMGLMNALLSSLTALLMVGIGRQLTDDPAVGWLTGIAFALYPVFIVTTTIYQSLTLHAFVLALAVFTSLVAWRRRRPGWVLLAGAMWGVMALGRPHLAAFWLLLAPLWWGLAPPRPSGEGNPLSRKAAWGLSLLAMLLVLTPWTLRNGRIHHRFVPIATSGGFNFWNGNNPFTTGSGHEVDAARAAAYLGHPVAPAGVEVVEMRPYPLPPEVQAQVGTMSETALDRALFRAGLSFIAREPAAWVALLGRKLRGALWFREQIGLRYQRPTWTLVYQVLYGLLLLLAVPGLALSRPHWRRGVLLYGLIAYYILWQVIFHTLTRYRWEVEPYYLLFAALTVVSLARRTDRHRPSAIRRLNLIGWVLGGGTLLWLLATLDWGAILQVLRSAHWTWALAGGGAIVLHTWARAYRWQALFLPARLPLPPVATAMLVGQSLNYILPARAGDLPRILWLGRTAGVSKTTALGTLAAEKVWDLLLLVLVLILAPLWVPLPDPLTTPLRLLALVALGAYVGVIVVAQGKRAIGGRLRSWSGGGWRGQVLATGLRLLEGLTSLYRPGVAGWALLWTVIAWGLGALANWMVFRAVGLALPFLAALMVSAALRVGIALPSPPAGIGVYEGAILLALAPWGVASETAFGYALLMRAVDFLPPLLMTLVLVTLTTGKEAEVR